MIEQHARIDIPVDDGRRFHGLPAQLLMLLVTHERLHEGRETLFSSRVLEPFFRHVVQADSVDRSKRRIPAKDRSIPWPKLESVKVADDFADVGHPRKHSLFEDPGMESTHILGGTNVRAFDEISLERKDVTLVGNDRSRRLKPGRQDLFGFGGVLDEQRLTVPREKESEFGDLPNIGGHENDTH